MLAAPLFSGFVFAGRMIATNWLGFVAIEALAVLGWTVFLGALLAALIALRTRGRDRICTTTLTPEGFQDVSPDSQAFPSAPSSPGDWSV